jgi:ATP-binding cassette subfamily B protein
MQAFHFMLRVLQPFKGWVVFYLALMTFIELNLVARTYVIKQLINNATQAAATHTASSLWWFAGVLLLLHVLEDPLTWALVNGTMIRLELHLKRYISALLIQQVHSHEYRFFQDRQAGSIASKINEAIRVPPRLLKIMVWNFLSGLVALIPTLYLMVQVHRGFAAAFIVWALFFLISSVAIVRHVNYLSSASAAAIGRVMGAVVDGLNNVLSVKLFAGYQHERQRIAQLEQDYFLFSKKRRLFLIKFYGMQALGLLAYVGVCLVLLIRGCASGEITPGDFSMIFMLNAYALQKLRQISEQMRDFSEEWSILENALCTIYAPLRVQDIPHAKIVQVTQGCIEFRQVRFGYTARSPLFSNLSLTIRSGEKVGLVGPSGCGKTTLISLLLRLFDLQAGAILIDGQDISQVTQDSLRSAIGMIPQDPLLFHRSLEENIAYGSFNASHQQVVQAAVKAHADDFISKLPEGYASLVGERGMKLSGGQRQRIAIARAFLKNAPILILDEATSQLDSVVERKIQTSLWELMQGKTALVVAHRLSTLLSMDRIIVLDKGAVVEEGTHQALLAKDGLYAQLWKSQTDSQLII